MGFIEKLFAIVMLPLSILIIMETTGIFSLDLFFDKVFIGAILMIALQLLTLFFVKKHHSSLRGMNIVTFIVLILPALAYIFSGVFNNFLKEQLPLILGVMMFVEAIYALH